MVRLRMVAATMLLVGVAQSVVAAPVGGPVSRCGGAYGKCGYVDKVSGRQLIPAGYEVAEPFSEGLAAVRIDGRYPQDELIAVKARIEAASQISAAQVQAGIDPAKLDFAYRLSGDTPPWRPVQVFDDGAKTYVLFPTTIAQSELPPLFLLGEKNQAALVNYRVSGRYIIVDWLFTVAELRLGNARQQIVRIERARAPERRS